MDATVRYARSVPVRDRYDVVVVGGGMSGVGAACAAADHGARVLLVERFAQLGGMGSIGGVGNWCYVGPLEGQGPVFHRLQDLMRRLGAYGEDQGWPTSTNKPPLDRSNGLFDHQWLPVACQHACRTSGVELRYHCEFVDVLREGRRVDGVVLHDRSGLHAVACGVLIDASGDGLAAQAAGCTVLSDRGEQDMPAGFMLFLRPGGDTPAAEVLEPDLELPHHHFPKLPDGRIAVKVRVYGHDTATGEGLNAAELAARRVIPNLVAAAAARHGAHLRLEHAVPSLGLREGPRIRGDATLTIDDVQGGRRWDDAVAWGAFTVDTVQPDVDCAIPPYQIPLGSLIAADCDNLLIAGRCCSADRLAMSSLRVMATSCLIGQATGVTAALAARDRATPRDVPAAAVRAALTAGEHAGRFAREVAA